MIGSLPRELALEICLRLPLKSLVSCAGVCKSWSSFIRSPFFISEHNKKPAEAHLLVRACVRTRSKEVLEDYILYHDRDDGFPVYTAFEFPIRSSGNFFHIYAICNGVVCLGDTPLEMDSNIFLWNPTVKKAVRLPRPNVRPDCGQLPKIAIGFGFDPVISDYKVVRVVYEVEHEKPYQYGPAAPRVTPQVELFTVSSGAWRNISGRAPPIIAGVPRIYYHEEKTSQAYLNEAVHWLGYQYDHKEQRGLNHSIVRFDLSHELFEEIALSDSLADKVPWAEASISVYRGRLSVALHERFANIPRCSLWIMEEYGVAESWTQLFKIDLRTNVRWGIGNGYDRPLGFSNTGKFLLERKDGCLISHNPESPRHFCLNLRRFKQKRYYNSFYVDSFTETLALLDKGTEFSYEKLKLQRKREAQQAENDLRRTTRLKKSTKSEDFVYF